MHILAMLLAASVLSGGQQPPKPSPPVAKPVEGHSAHLATPQEQSKQKPKEPTPAATEADPAAAFPQCLAGHAAHDRPINGYILFDQPEWQGGDSGGVNLES